MARCRRMRCLRKLSFLKELLFITGYGGCFIVGLQSKLNEEHLKNFNEFIETELTSVDKFIGIIDSIENSSELYSTISTIKAKRKDGKDLTQEDKELLKEKGFTPHKISARIYLEDRHEELSNKTTHPKDVIVKDLKEILATGFDFVELERKPVEYDLANILGRPTHWPVEFPEVPSDESDNDLKQTIYFDIIIGNPPYGDILSEEEKMFVSTYVTGDYREIAANFIERELKLLKEGGYFGNVTTVSILHHGSRKELHDMIQENLDNARISSFTRRPRKVFENAEINVAITTGKKNTQGDNTSIRTGDFIRLTRNSREEKIRDPSYGSIENLVLRDEMGGTEVKRGYEALPKVGNETKRNILLKLTNCKRNIRQLLGGGLPLYFRRAANYWMNITLENLQGIGNMKQINFEENLERKFVFLAMNSSLFYLYWMTYCNMHDVTKSQVKRFPVPDKSDIEKHEEKISEYTEELKEVIRRNFNPSGKAQQFNMPAVKPLIDEIDEILIGKIYGLMHLSLIFFHLNNFYLPSPLH